MTVPGQELPDAQRSRRMVRPDEHDVAEAVRDELHPPEDEGPHQDLAELGVRLHQRQQLLVIELDDLARRAGARPHQRAAVREHVGLAGELARPMNGDDGLAGIRRLDDLDLSRGDDVERDDSGARRRRAPLRQPRCVFGRAWRYGQSGPR